MKKRTRNETPLILIFGPSLLLLAGAILGALLAGCSSKSNPTAASASSQVQVVKNMDGTTTVAVVTRPGWPPVNGQESFTVLADDQLARNYMVVLDGSGSMAGPKEADAKKALLEFVNMVPFDANLGLYVFDNKGMGMRVELAKGDANRAAFVAAVQSMSAGGGTPLYDAIREAHGKLEEQGRKQRGYGDYHLVVVTDGEANWGQDSSIVGQILEKTPIVIHTIGFHIGKNHSLNQAGRVDYKTADSVQELKESLKETLAESPNFSVDEFK